MGRTNKPFCPLIKDDCRRDCQWCDPVTEISEDGIGERLECAIMDIAAAALNMAGVIDENGWMADDD